MKKTFLTICSILALYSCNNDDLHDGSSSPVSSLNTRTINKSGSVEGVNYSFNNVGLNPNLVILNSENVTILSSQDELSNGYFNLKILSDEIGKEIIPGKTIYLITDEDTFIRNITSVSKNNDIYKIETTEPSIGDIFESGSLNISLSANNLGINKKSSLIALSNSVEKDFFFNPLIINKDFSYGGITFNPGATIDNALSIKLGFAKSQKIPSEVEMYLQTNSFINPTISFDKALNKKFNHDFINEVPQFIIDSIKKIEKDVKIPSGTYLGDIPVKISVNQINLPTEVIANVQRNSYLKFATESNTKIGFKLSNGANGLNTNFIYDNSIKKIHNVDGDLLGEVITDMKMTIIPNVKVFNTSLIDVNGKVILGVKTFNIGNGNINQSSNFYTQGNFYSSALFTFGGLGIPVYTTDLYNKNEELWKKGEFSRNITFSNFTTGSASAFPCSGLTSFGYNILLNYKYPIMGKVLPGNLEMTYDVYADNGALLEYNKKITISPSDVTADSFKFYMCIPFRRINFFNISRVSYLKNITIRDENGYSANGILDPISGNTVSEVKFIR
ncbi:hypothetical protein Ga0061079_1056 [Apibacter mensalis]|uniref:Uncharacterized protein n=1 Tax=Apibacter mensalis TaxID=1586267 RepID=A0A0X3ANX2_9FLAO|nr:hypothetical protein [Apibacter mensalis]CVK16052.1 hypothetical protein Ga0061079_1056 [Apibacter mensalis]